MRRTTRLPHRPARRLEGLSRRALRTLLVPLGAISLAALLPQVLPRSDAPDLAGLTPRTERLDGYILVRWLDLERGYRSLKHGALQYPGAAVRVLGYVAELHSGEPAGRLLLVPETGSAQRFGDREIEVRLKPGAPVAPAAGSLVWAWGTWKPLPGNPNRETPLYVLQEARVEPAGRAEIAKYFR